MFVLTLQQRGMRFSVALTGRKASVPAFTDPFSSYSLPDLEKAHEDLDISFLRRALEKSEGNQRKAAEEMAISYDSFRGLYRKYREHLKPRSER